MDHRAFKRIRVGVAAQQLHLRAHADARARVAVTGMARVARADTRDVVVVGMHPAVKNFKQGRFARPIWANQADPFPFRNAERNVLE